MRRPTILLVLPLLAGLTACSGSQPAPASGSGATPPASAGAQINGAGATFPSPLYSKWFAEYGKLHRTSRSTTSRSDPARGSVSSPTARSSSARPIGPMTDEQLKAAPGNSASADRARRGRAVYNIPGITAELKFTGPLLADIMLGKFDEMERSRHREAESGRHAAGHGNHRRASVRRIGDDLHLG